MTKPWATNAVCASTAPFRAKHKGWQCVKALPYCSFLAGNNSFDPQNDIGFAAMNHYQKKELYMFRHLSAALLTTLPAPLCAQASGPPAPPHVNMVDGNFVNRASGETLIPIEILEIGAGELSLKLIGYSELGGRLFSSNIYTSFDVDTRIPNKYHVSLGKSGDTFDGALQSGVMVNGGRLTINSDTSKVVTLRDGSALSFPPGLNVATSIKKPNGLVLDLFGSRYIDQDGSILQSNGLLIKYFSDGSMTAVNLAHEYCDPTPGVRCSTSTTWPTALQASVTFPSPGVVGRVDGYYTVRDYRGGTHRFDIKQGAVVKYIDSRSSSSAARTYNRCTYSPVNCYYTVNTFSGQANTSPMYDRVVSAAWRGNNWSFNYRWEVGPYGAQYLGSGPEGQSSSTTWAPPGFTPYVSVYSDHTGTYQFDSLSRVKSIILPEGNSDFFTYDARGNVIRIDHSSKGGGTVVSEYIGFDASCSASVAKCNKPNYHIDAKGQRTDYSYDNDTGQLLSISVVAP